MDKRQTDVQMVSRERHDTYVIAIDTVDFSSEEDPVQLSIFADLLSAVALLPTESIQDRLVLMTGDGLILAFRCNETVPLKLAIALAVSWHKTKTKEVRVGINFGPAYWISLSDGTRQLIGHAINWAVRVMSAVPVAGISMSADYYERCIVPSKSEFRGVTFTYAANRQTKKGENIRAVDVGLE